MLLVPRAVVVVLLPARLEVVPMVQDKMEEMPQLGVVMEETEVTQVSWLVRVKLEQRLAVAVEVRKRHSSQQTKGVTEPTASC